MPMTFPNKIMGKVAVSPFGKTTKSSTPASSSIKRNFPVLLALLLLGVAIVLFMRSRSYSQTGPALNLISTTAPDQSAIDNLTASVLAMQGLVTTNPSIPGGGTSTPITPVPSSSTPWSVAPTVDNSNPMTSTPLEYSDVPMWAGLPIGSMDTGGRRVIGPDEIYNPPVIFDEAGVPIGYNPGKQYTPNTARAWWDKWFANPYDLSKINSADLPGSLVLTQEERERARAINNAFARIT